MATFSTSSPLALSFPSPHFSLLVLPQTFFWRCLPWLLDNEKNQVSSAIMRLWDPFFILEKSSIYLPWAPCWKENHVGLLLLPFSGIFWRVFLSFLNYSSKFHIMAADVDLGPSGPAWSLGLINGLKPLLLTFLSPQITGPNWLWALKTNIWDFWAQFSVVEKMGLYSC